MELIKNIGKKILIVLAIGLTIIAIGSVGQLDHDEYIEANLTPKTQMPIYYEK